MKKFSKFLFVIFSIWSTNTFSQTFPWAQSVLGNNYDEGNSVCHDTLGNIYICGSFNGSTLSFGTTTLTNSASGYMDVCLAKYDANGNFLWAKSAGSVNMDEGKAICADRAGNVFITGITSPQAVFGPYTLTPSLFENAFVAKYDANGNVLWVKNSIGGYGNSVACDTSGNVFVAGKFSNPTVTFGTYTLTNAGSGNHDYFLAKYDTNGNLIWALSNGGTGSENIYSIGTDVAGNVLATGYFGSSSLTLGTYTLSNTGSLDVLLIKYDTNGNVIWAKSAVGTGNDGSNSVAVEPSGDSYITGNYSSAKLIFGTDTIKKLGPTSTYATFFVKYDPNGNIKWAKSAGGINIDIGYSVASYSAGVFFAGYFDSPNLVLGTYTLNKPMGSTDALYITNFDPNGNLICCEALTSGGVASANTRTGLSADKYGSAFICSEFIGPSLIVGTNTLTTLSSGNVDIFVTRFSCAAVATDIENGLAFDESQVSIFPNPNNGMFKIKLEEAIDKATLMIFNSLGQKVYEQKMFQGSNEVVTNDLAEGLYHCVIMQDKQQRMSGKLVIVH